MKKGAYIFDLDGTLMDSEILWTDAMRELLGEHGVPVSQEDALALVYGRSWRDVYADVRNRVPGLGLSVSAMQEDLQVRFARLRSGRDVSIPGSIRLLKRLRASAPVCIVSGSSRSDIAHAVDFLELSNDVVFFLGAEDYAPGKPAPACFLMAAERLSVAADACVVFEDSWAGVQAARSAGMYCVALARPGAVLQDVSSADIILDDLSKFDG